jgi:putative alpha-1,2-mannosidase
LLFLFATSSYSKLGYIPVELSDRATCLTLAYAHNDFAISQMAAALNRTADAQFFLNRSQNYLNVWDRSQSFFCPRSLSGAFQCPIDKLNVVS